MGILKIIAHLKNIGRSIGHRNNRLLNSNIIARIIRIASHVILNFKSVCSYYFSATVAMWATTTDFPIMATVATAQVAIPTMKLENSPTTTLILHLEMVFTAGLAMAVSKSTRLRMILTMPGTTAPQMVLLKNVTENSVSVWPKSVGVTRSPLRSSPCAKPPRLVPTSGDEMRNTCHFSIIMVIRPTAIPLISTMSAALDVVTWLTISSQIIELNGNLSADTAAKLTPQTALATVTEPDHQRLDPLEQLVEAQLMRPLGRVTTMFPQPSLLEPMMSTTARLTNIFKGVVPPKHGGPNGPLPVVHTCFCR